MIIDAEMANRLNRAAFQACADDVARHKAGDEVSDEEIKKLFEAERSWTWGVTRMNDS